MQIIENPLFTILLPDKGYLLINKNTSVCYKKVYLGKNDSPDNYGEVVDDKYVNMEFVVELDDIKENINSTNEMNEMTIDLLLLTLDEMYVSFEPILSMVPMTMDLEHEEKVSKFVNLYLLMIKKGLKTIDEIPEKFREQVNRLL